MKSEEEIYNEILVYINGNNHRRPCTLQTIKKVLRTPKIINLVFSRPDVFRLTSEIKHVPVEYLTEEILVRYILAEPEEISLLDESYLTLPVLVAFEFAKRRYEHLSALAWNQFGEKISTVQKYREFRDSVSDICDALPSKYNDDDILSDYLLCINKVSKEVIEYCSSIGEVEKSEQYVPKYSVVDFKSKRRVCIFVSGCPDSGKTTFSSMLASSIKNAVCFDSDMLLERDMLCTPLSQLVREDVKVIVFSDVYADRFFRDEEIGDSLVVNILIEPVSIEKMYRYSKYMQRIPFEIYKRNEVEKYHYDFLENPIRVTNDYTERLWKQVAIALKEIANRLEIPQLGSEESSHDCFQKKIK